MFVHCYYDQNKASSCAFFAEPPPLTRSRITFAEQSSGSTLEQEIAIAHAGRLAAASERLTVTARANVASQTRAGERAVDISVSVAIAAGIVFVVNVPVKQLRRCSLAYQ